MTNPFPLKMAGFELPTSGQFSLPGDNSLAKTLAEKFRTRMPKIFRKHGRNLRYEWKLPNGEVREICFAENTDWSIDRKAFSTRPDRESVFDRNWISRTRSPLDYPCLICGRTDAIQMHHVRHIRKMSKRKPKGFTAVMAALNRKQVPVCEDCHRKIHRGEYDDISLKDLAYDFAARPS